MSDERKTGALAALLREHVSREQRAELASVEGLEALLRGHVEAARAAWPSLTLPAEDYVRHLTRHLPTGKAAEVLRILHGADLYLACACAQGEPAALRAFEQDVLRYIPARLGALSPSMVEEVLQVLRERLLVGGAGAPPRIGSYAGRAPLLTWVGIVAARIAGELVERNGRELLVTESPQVFARMLATANPEHEVLREDARQMLVEAIQKVVATLSAQERALLRLHYFHGFTMDRLAQLYGDSRSGVARKVTQARQLLLEGVQAELAGQLRHDALAVESLLGLVRSQLDISLHRMLG
ncbi:RNA polymerase subunit sigma-70 [Pyxidicoccus fallax]|uniref:RNA polymerase subunit sigma-70 n=1 Tax=Pyxidicoccus fallax TaxID=394095 RepID=A0A848L4P7_9BACT|nr:sigma factor-like helix-turn-helix DNA-binding protein [Pyxidicoccus fallax]NMO13427.1 RNA polymerase subunit sigma-70 [Pyxidicoccus fallax]NPC78323.1 RNA polymerase subunit sigma-70 [Pyxidicoccus fallax]